MYVFKWNSIQLQVKIHVYKVYIEYMSFNQTVLAIDVYSNCLYYFLPVGLLISHITYPIVFQIEYNWL